MSAVRRRASEAGYSLAELLIASSILGIFAVVISMASAFSGREMGQLRHRAVSAIDMRTVVEHVRRDLGAAERVDVLGNGRVRIRRDAVAARLLGHGGNGTDPGIEYRLSDGVLLRKDKVHNTEVVVARDLRRFDAEDLGGGDVLLTIETGTEKSGHRIGLQWVDDE